RARDRGRKIEISRIHEIGHELPTRRRPIIVFNRETNVLHVEVQCVPIEKKEERRHEQQHEQRAPIARDLAKFLSADGNGFTQRSSFRRRRETRLRATASRGRWRGCPARAPAGVRRAQPRRYAPASGQRAPRCRIWWSSE